MLNLLMLVLLMALDIKFSNDLDICLSDEDKRIERIDRDYYDEYDPVNKVNWRKKRPGVKEVEFCKDYDPDRLEESGYISEEDGLKLCVGWVSVYFPPYLSFCKKDKLKYKITLKRIPYYKDKRFSIKDRYVVLPKGLRIYHDIFLGKYREGVVFLKEGYNVDDIKHRDKDWHYPHLIDEVDLSKPLYISIKNKNESKALRKGCREIYEDYVYLRTRAECEAKKITACGGFYFPYFEEEKKSECYMFAIVDDILDIKKGLDYEICKFISPFIDGTIDGRELKGEEYEKYERDRWREKFNEFKDKAKGYIIKRQDDLGFCVTGEYEFSVKGVDWWE